MNALSCPFCGARAVGFTGRGDDNGELELAVRCEGCKATGPFVTEAGSDEWTPPTTNHTTIAVVAWNRRRGPQ